MRKAAPGQLRRDGYNSPARKGVQGAAQSCSVRRLGHRGLWDGIKIGVWRSPVARVVRDDEAPGSNPGTPTTFFTARCDYSNTPRLYCRLLTKVAHRYSAVAGLLANRGQFLHH